LCGSGGVASSRRSVSSITRLVSRGLRCSSATEGRLRRG
jgi:hypothetical protein